MCPSWHCGAFISTTEVLRNMPLSIHRDACLQKEQGIQSFSARSEARGKGNYLEPRVVYHICFSYQHKALCQGVSFFLSDSTFSQWAMSQCWLSLALCLSGSLVSDEQEAEANPARVTFYQCGLHLPHFTSKRRHSDPFSHLCLNVFTITLLLCYSSGRKTWSNNIFYIQRLIRTLKGIMSREQWEGWYHSHVCVPNVKREQGSVSLA